MSTSVKDPQELKAIYERRFKAERVRYRQRLWATLVESFFQPMIPPGGTVLDLGCGYGEFINQVQADRRYAMDLNPKAAEHLDPAVSLILQDCSQRWPLPDASLDAVFTSNFFEHLPDKLALKRTLLEAARCLKPGGRLIALGPNIKFVQGAYWDFWDHFLCLTEASLGEALENNGYIVRRSEARFLPYTTINQPAYPMAFVRLYLRLPIFWRIFGRQFLVVAEKR
ncbi:MAG: class I SAM-dependent methyltransferase [Opitutaceae bacterium]|nr:class I SAM-dependent methyltransferase [Opitutaceae bacterium]